MGLLGGSLNSLTVDRWNIDELWELEEPETLEQLVLSENDFNSRTLKEAADRLCSFSSRLTALRELSLIKDGLDFNVDTFVSSELAARVEVLDEGCLSVGSYKVHSLNAFPRLKGAHSSSEPSSWYFCSL